jgi:hypothetical protein
MLEMITLPNNYRDIADREQAILSLLSCQAGQVHMAHYQLITSLEDISNYWEYFRWVTYPFIGGLTIIVCEDNSVLVIGETVDVFPDFTDFMNTMTFEDSTFNDLHRAEQEFLIWAFGSEEAAEEYIAK